MFVDSHCHLDRLKLERYDNGLTGAVEAAHEAGVLEMLCVAIDMQHIPHLLEIAETYPGVYASVGVHPSTDDGNEPTVETLVELAKHPKVLAIGETGLDYYYSAERKAQQQERFYNHLKAADLSKKPVIVHTRDARDDTLAMIKEGCNPEFGGVLHCFTESWEMARAALDFNFMISFSGIITFRNADELREVVRQVPLDRILIETDSPYLAPVPYRGKPNEPRYVPEVAKCVADIKSISIEDVARITTENYSRLFNRALA